MEKFVEPSLESQLESKDGQIPDAEKIGGDDQSPVSPEEMEAAMRALREESVPAEKPSAETAETAETTLARQEKEQAAIEELRETMRQKDLERGGESGRGRGENWKENGDNGDGNGENGDGDGGGGGGSPETRRTRFSHEIHTEFAVCEMCKGSGRKWIFFRCPSCGGSGHVPIGQKQSTTSVTETIKAKGSHDPNEGEGWKQGGQDGNESRES